MPSAVLLLLWASTQTAGFTPQRAVFAPPPPIAAPVPVVITPTSRVRAWTRAQRRCERRRNGSCLMTAPDLLKPDIAGKGAR